MSSNKSMKLLIKSIAILVVTGALLALIWMTFYQVRSLNQSLSISEQNYQSAYNNINRLIDASNNLTQDARNFVSSADIEALNDYVKELKNDQNREIAKAEILSLMEIEAPRTCEYISEALDYSNTLAESEIHAMKLMCVAENISAADLPADIAEYELTPAEMELSPADAKTAAYEMVYGKAYCDLKDQITGSARSAEEILVLIQDDYFANETEQLELKLAEMHIVLLAFTMYVVLLIAGSIYTSIKRELRVEKNE